MKFSNDLHCNLKLTSSEARFGKKSVLLSSNDFTWLLVDIPCKNVSGPKLVFINLYQL